MKLRIFAAAALFLTAAVPGFCQVDPSAIEGPMRLKIGAGFSDYKGDFFNGNLTGGAIWVDCYPCAFPKLGVFHGLGVEAEARGIRAQNTLPTQIGAQQEASIGGGPTYTWGRFRKFKPYAKLDVEYAAMEFYFSDPNFHRISQAMYAPGGGIDYRVYRNVWVRGDYEYQIWPHIFHGGNWDLDPQGITVGAEWELRPSHRH